MMIEPDNDKVFSNLENIDVAIVEDSFLTQRFKLPDGIYDIIPLKARKKLILKYKRGTKSASFLALKKLLKEDKDLMFFPKEAKTYNPSRKLEKIEKFKTELSHKNLAATFEFKNGNIKNIFIDSYYLYGGAIFYGVNLSTYKQILSFDTRYYETISPRLFFFKSLSVKKKIRFIATTKMKYPRYQRWSQEIYSWKGEGTLNHIDRCEVFYPRIKDENINWGPTITDFNGVYRKFLHNFKDGKKNGRQLTFRKEGGVMRIAHYNLGKKDGWSLHLKKNHGFDPYTYNYKSSDENIWSARFFQNDVRIDNPFVLASNT